jgi:hypothetical protein
MDVNDMMQMIENFDIILKLKVEYNLFLQNRFAEGSLIHVSHGLWHTGIGPRKKLYGNSLNKLGV